MMAQQVPSATAQASSRLTVPATLILNGRGSFSVVNDVGIMVLDVAKWQDADVVQLMEETSRLGNRITATANISHFLGEGFSASHRKIIVDWLAREQIAPSPRNALLTDSKIMRAALTAYSFLTRAETKAFLPTERTEVCQWVCRGLQANPQAVGNALEACYRVLKKNLP